MSDYYSTKLSRDEWTVHGRRHHIQIDRTDAPTGRADEHGEDILHTIYYVHDRSGVINTEDQYETDAHGFTRLKDAVRYATDKLRDYDDHVDPPKSGGHTRLSGSETILFLKETGAPHYKRPVSIVYHPDFPPMRYEVLYRIGRPGLNEVKTHWFGRKPDAMKFAYFAHEASDQDLASALSSA